MKTLWIRLMRKFGFYPKPIPLAGIYGIIDGPQSAAETADPYVMSLRRISGEK